MGRKHSVTKVIVYHIIRSQGWMTRHAILVAIAFLFLDILLLSHCTDLLANGQSERSILNRRPIPFWVENRDCGCYDKH